MRRVIVCMHRRSLLPWVHHPLLASSRKPTPRLVETWIRIDAGTRQPRGRLFGLAPRRRGNELKLDSSAPSFPFDPNPDPPRLPVELAYPGPSNVV